MSGLVPNICIVDGGIVRLNVRKLKETLNNCKRRVFERAPLDARYFAIKHSGLWRTYEVFVDAKTRYRYPVFLRGFPNEDAAAMWLLHKAMRSEP